ncbi:MAG: hypothetical protein QF632_05700 [Candidatus Woesearchaeota archaeon]|jgi:predicted CopG family antitoxin|nr:hypothetical protein [Candidatus Woesearchaeota archaeon]MDP7324226.1 hypothetical protein [Candidatus Woesearchaeota archaeon]MDP7457569.1 hypothetical protein [Candidatus Woesearchaeota archaeon]|tara:strand:+ start:1050 stop:1223 length:174 start_codon:yes stop_codon:yes gene_type:complete
MVTTIQVSEEVVDWLKNFRDRSRLDSYNDVIKGMIKKISKQDSLYGFLGKKGGKHVR